MVAAALNTHWWTVPVLVLQAAKNGLIEEVVVVGYLMTRLRERIDTCAPSTRSCTSSASP